MNKTEEKQQKQPFFTASRMAAIAIFAAISGVLYAVSFPMPVAFAPWLEFNFSDVPVLIGSFALGAPSGAIIVALRTLIKLLIKPTTSAFVGEAADILCGLALAVPAGLFYAKKKTKGGAALACLIGGLCSVAMGVIANRFMIIPWYAKQMGMNTLVNMLLELYPACTEETFYKFYLWLSVAPFNALRCLFDSLITFSVYKNVSALLKKADEKYGKKKPPEKIDGEIAEKTVDKKQNPPVEEEKNNDGNEKQA